MKKISKPHTYSTLITDLAGFIEQGRKTAVRYVNTALVTTYWLIGRRIVEYEQKGGKRAEYGKELLQKLSQDLNRRFGRGFSPDNIEAMRSFYLNYPINISETVSRKLEEQNSETPSRNSEITLAIHPLTERFTLSWSHYRLLLRLDEPFKREFYEVECIRGNWSVRQLDRQIQSMHKKKTVVEYALGGLNNKVFASKYKLQLPDPKVLKTEIDHERQRLLEMKILKSKGMI